MKTLFTDYDLSGLQLTNRIVMAPMTRSRTADTVPDEETARYYAQRAGAGLIVTEGAQVSRQGVGYLFTPGIYMKEQAAGWKKVTRAVHEQGGKIFSQLWHVGRISHASLHENGVSPVGPTSKMAENTTSFAYDENGNPGSVQVSRPRPLLTSEIKSTVQDFANAAEKAMEAGFDGVEVHGANGYLIEQFINAGINDRDDQYGGGTIGGRLRFALEVVEAVVAQVGAGRVGLRISPFNRTFDMPAFEGEGETWIALAHELSKRSLAYVHISNRDALTANQEGSVFLRRFRVAYAGTLILAGLYTKEAAQRDVREGLTDLVAFGRPFISNPDLVERLKNDWPVTIPDPSTFYGGDHVGYTDYPVYETWLERS
ncbi:alkene reductase [Pollutimonas thiosulfatoxidans]|uniref:Alkene reductase n=1 Tax=Pollutimonas thiosulfatoxidans TaxID=2028345 RepID=A0A410GA87_9BURK|nr:alkene reductase [Pollutimonas thiosulfatoxidans]QAA93206.1 alkene reductase [Pollutimonas thiosulfatoxidans]